MDQSGDPASARQPSPPVRATQHATSTYVPAPAEERNGIALCLSGGGYRAALFHLGALRRLNELEILPRVDTITAVSGGSIIAAYLARAIAALPNFDNGMPEFEERIARPMRALTARNIRTSPILDRFVPGEWFNPSASVEALAAEYATVLGDFRLSQLSPRPNFVICATDMVFGSHWVCERTRVGNDVAGYVSPPDEGLLGNLSRYDAIKGSQVSAIRKRWLISNFLSGTLTGAYWGIDSAVSSYDLPVTAGYSKSLAEKFVAKVRTDLDAFSPAEMAVLENHGYLLADAAMTQHIPSLLGPIPAPAVVPHPEWLDEDRVQQALADSHRRSLFGRW